MLLRITMLSVLVIGLIAILLLLWVMPGSLAAYIAGTMMIGLIIVAIIGTVLDILEYKKNRKHEI